VTKIGIARLSHDRSGGRWSCLQVRRL